MKIGVLSDTHSHWDDKFALYLAECDEIWHAGDIGDISILERLEALGPRVRAVSGNVDHGMVRRRCPELLTFTAGGLKVLMTHIGGYPGRYAPGMATLLREERPQIMVAGHSHILKVMYDDRLDVLHINPGAAGLQGWHKQRTLIRFCIDPNPVTGQPEPHHLEVIELGAPRL